MGDKKQRSTIHLCFACNSPATSATSQAEQAHDIITSDTYKAMRASRRIGMCWCCNLLVKLLQRATGKCQQSGQPNHLIPCKLPTTGKTASVSVSDFENGATCSCRKCTAVHSPCCGACQKHEHKCVEHFQNSTLYQKYQYYNHNNNNNNGIAV